MRCRDILRLVLVLENFRSENYYNGDRRAWAKEKFEERGGDKCI
jgi:hypothetical protein